MRGICEETVRCTMCPAKMVYDGSKAAIYTMLDPQQASRRNSRQKITAAQDCEHYHEVHPKME